MTSYKSNVPEVKAVVSRLNTHEREGFSDLLFDHINEVHNDLIAHVSCRLTATLMQGTATDIFLHSTSTPTPKADSTDKSDGVTKGIFFSLIVIRVHLHDMLIMNQQVCNEHQHRVHRNNMACN
jgi:hypothetical protein